MINLNRGMSAVGLQTCVVCSSFFLFSSSSRRFCCFRETTSVKPSSLALDWGSSVVVTSG